VAGLIERNLIVDTIGYNLQIKHQRPRPEDAGLPAGRSTTIIRHNVFAKPEAGTAEAARPNVLVGHFPLAGPGADDDYAIYGNFFYQNRHEALFQGEGNVALYANLFVNVHGDAVRIQPHNDVPRRIEIAHNTVIAKGAGISVMQKEGAPSWRQDVRANAVFAGVPLAGGVQAGNLAGTMEDAERFLERPFAPPGELDLSPKRSKARAMRGASVTESAAPLPGWERDFDGRPWLPGSIGAYSASGGRPKWLPRLALKPE
jgi:hypothetical protein